MSDKPTYVKPAFYAFCYQKLKEIAKEFGYNLLIHGSMNRDCDLVAVAWVDKPKNELLMIQAFDRYINGLEGVSKKEYLFSVLPGGRQSYVVNINRGEKFSHEDAQYYLDISVVNPNRLNKQCNNPTCGLVTFG